MVRCANVASRRDRVARDVLTTRRTGIERRVDDRKLDGLGGEILTPKLLRDPQRRFAPRGRPTQASRRLGLGEFAAELGPRKLQMPRQA